MSRDLDKYKRHFIFDISSGYVSGAVVFRDTDSKKPTIEFSIKKDIQPLAVHNLTELRKNTAIAINEVCQAIANFVNLNSGDFFIESGSVFLSSPWISFNNYTLNDERIRPFKITEPYLESIIEKKLDQDKKQKEKVLIDSQIISVQANGYQINLHNLIGQEASRIDISILDTFMNFYNKEFIETSINNHFNFLKLRFNSFLPVLFNQIRYIYDLEDDFIFLDMTGSVTDFGIFSNGKIRNISSLPIGKNHILREVIKQGMASDMRIARSVLIMYFRNELEKGLKDKLQKIIKDFGNKFKKDLQEILDKFQSSRIPLNVFILSSFETKFLLQELNIFEKPQQLFFIDEPLIKNFVDSEDKYFDIFLAIEADYIFYNN